MDNFEIDSILNRNLALKAELESARVEIQLLRDQLAAKPKEVVVEVEKIVELKPEIIYRDKIVEKQIPVIKTVEKIVEVEKIVKVSRPAETVEPVIIYRDKIVESPPQVITKTIKVESKEQAAIIAKLKHDNAKLIKKLADAKNQQQSVIIKTIEKQVDNSEKYIKKIDDLKAVINNLSERLSNADNQW